MFNQYSHREIEKKWQDKWDESGIYEAEDFSKKPKYYCLLEFPYPSGAGLHVGHLRSHIAIDIIARQKRMSGYNVLYPIGWDAFGLPTENFAIKIKTHPKIVTKNNIKNFTKQMKSYGPSFDWSREINTTDPEYYKWTQWIFLKLFNSFYDEKLDKARPIKELKIPKNLNKDKKREYINGYRMAYESKMAINWCPSCKIGLANEEVVNGACERCGAPAEKKMMKQWMLKITKYADRLIKDLDTVDYLNKIKTQQVNWIGKSEGITVKFQIQNSKSQINSKSKISAQGGPVSGWQNSKLFLEVFTTRPDTLFGCTYMVVAPENPIISEQRAIISNYDEVEKYINEARNKSDLERQVGWEKVPTLAEGEVGSPTAKHVGQKTGVELKGIKAVNPVNNEEIPIWIADYVLASYGTGAIMAVPAHDERDFEFAKKYDLPIKEVVQKISNKQQILEKDIIGVGILMKTNDEKILLQERDNNTNINPGKIAPFGGGIEKSESYLDTVIRELKEELDLKVNKKDIKEIGAFRSHAYKGKSIMMFQIYDIDKSDLKLNEGQGIVKLSLAEAAKHNLVTDFTKEVLKTVVANKLKVFMDSGVNINSDFLNGLETEKAKKKMIEWLAKNKLGKKAINYKLRDWVFSRQHYWGEPIPIIKCENCGNVALEEKDLPLKLPEVKNYEPTETGESPLAKIKKWTDVKCPKCGKPAKRETDTMPNWAGSSWYFLRYLDPKNNQEFVSTEKIKYWMPVDLYNGGMEHTTLHLLYSRFWHKFLFDLGYVNTLEPYKKRRSHGMILAEDGQKMSKSRGNVINPDDIIKKYGADTLRLYEMFIGPYGDAIPWNTNGLIGMGKFLERVWKVINKIIEDNLIDNSNKFRSNLIHKTIKKVSEDIESMKFNTAISILMIQFNDISWRNKLNNKGKWEDIGKRGTNKIDHWTLESFLILLSPFAPHVVEELWTNLGHKNSICKEKWPEYNSELIKEKEIELVIQINGKVRDRIKTPADISENGAKKIALESEKIKKWIGKKEIKKIIFVKGKLVNVVV